MLLCYKPLPAYLTKASAHVHLRKPSFIFECAFDVLFMEIRRSPDVKQDNCAQMVHQVLSLVFHSIGCPCRTTPESRKCNVKYLRLGASLKCSALENRSRSR